MMAAESQRAGTVLVVEDSPWVREVMLRILRKAGYNAAGAADGLEALQAVDEELPDLILLDVMMPRMDGLTLLSRLRQRPEFKDLPVIVVSALSDEQRMKQAEKLGARAYLVKARFSYDELLQRVQENLPQ